jgi:hypothetical protein
MNTADDVLITSISPGDTRSCNVIYSWSYTPLLWWASHPVIYPGLVISLNVQDKNAYKWWSANYDNLGGFIIDVTIDDLSLEFEGFLGEGQSLDSKGHKVQGRVHNFQKNSIADLKVRFPGAGYAYNMTATTRVCDITGTDCYETRIVPSITSISASAGYTTGG